MRISDWSSDVCSSDLPDRRWKQQAPRFLSNRQFAALNRAAEPSAGLPEQLADGQRRHADRVNRQKEKPAVFIEQFAAIGYQIRESLLQLPDFAFRTAAIFGWVKQYAIIAPPPPHLSGHEFCRVIDDPACGPIRQPRQLRIGAGSLY